MGVDLFFVLSGFLITALLLQQRAQPGWLARFYVRRGLRIWPLYYLVVALAFLVGPQLPPPLGLERWRYEWWVSLLHLQNLGSALGPAWAVAPNFLVVTWSLAIEEQFYFVWPMLLGKNPARRLVQLCVGILIAEPAIRALMLFTGSSPGSVYLVTFTHLDGLAAGALVALLPYLPGDGGRQTLLRLRRAWLMLPLAVTLYWVFLHGENALGASTAPFSVVQTLRISGIYSLVALGCAGILVAVLLRDSQMVERAMCWRPLRALGRVAFGVYLLHWPIFEATRAWLLPSLARWQAPELVKVALATAAELCAVLSLAVFSWTVFERPVQERGARWLRARSAPASLRAAG
jgi:peptidoglycan/LPS O-acetylase OafA/YrhL